MANFRFSEPCPFNELTLLNSSYFLNLYSTWTSKQCEFEILDLALSLIYFDGVINSAELLLAINELLLGKIYDDGDAYFVDINSAEIGLRRVILSVNTLLILNKTALKVAEIKTVELIEKMLQNQLHPILQQYRRDLEIKQNELLTLSQIAQDYYATKLHGPLREWMNGNLKARTLRIESVARQKFERVERLTFSPTQFRRPRSILSDLYVRDVLKNAVENTGYGGSPALRVQKIKDKLNLGLEQFIQIADFVTAKFVLNICAQDGIKTPGTIRNHYQSGRDFIKFAARDVGSYEEFCALDFTKIVQQYFQINEENQDTIIAINYLLKMPDINSKISISTDKTKLNNKSNIPYADFMSEHEIQKLNQLLQESALPPSQKKDALHMVNLLRLIPQRREDIASLRLKDIRNTNTPHIVLTSASTGKKKSQNANRVVEAFSPELEELFKYVEAKKAVFVDHRAGIFSHLDNPNSFEGGYENLAIIGCGMRAVTGARDLSPHNFRTGIITKIARKILSIEFCQKSTSDVLRLALYESYVFSGHGDLTTMFEHYVCEMECIRREWIDHLVAEHLVVNPLFFSSISDQSPETLRKYAKDQNKLNNLLAKAFADKDLSFKKRVIEIKDFLTADFDTYPFDDKNGSSEDRQLTIIRYQAMTIAGIAQNVAANTLSILEEDQLKATKNLQLLNFSSQSTWTTNLTSKEILNLGHFQRFLTRLGEIPFSLKQIIGICQTFNSEVWDAWQLETDDFDLFPEDMFIRIQSARFDTIFSFSEKSYKSEAKAIVERFLPTHKEHIAHRNFSKNKNVQIRFVFRGDEKSSWPRRCREATAWVTLFLISLFTTKMED